MSVETHRVLMGACDWRHPAWNNDYYSEDLPEDWHLGFYSNEFPVVFVPASRWLDNDALSEWGEDVSDSFRFVLEIPAEVLADRLHFSSALKQVKILEGFCLGVVFKLEKNILNNLPLLVEHIKQAQEIVPVCIDVDGNAASTELNAVLAEYHVSQIWHGETQKPETYQSGSLAIAHISDEKLDMVALRRIVEGCLAASTEECTSVLIFEGNPPSLEMLRNADIIINLL